MIESYKFLSTSLEKLVENLKQTGTTTFYHTIRQLGDDPILFTEAIYPYEYLTSSAVFEETQFPPKKALYSKLSEQCITGEEYERAHTMFKKAKCRNLRDYTELYVTAMFFCYATAWKLSESYHNPFMTFIHHNS